MRLDREKLQWDPDTEQIIGDDEAAKMLEPAVSRPVEAAGDLSRSFSHGSTRMKHG